MTADFDFARVAPVEAPRDVPAFRLVEVLRPETAPLVESDLLRVPLVVRPEEDDREGLADFVRDADAVFLAVPEVFEPADLVAVLDPPDFEAVVREVDLLFVLLEAVADLRLVLPFDDPEVLLFPVCFPRPDVVLRLVFIFR